ncbi:MAG: MoaD/ThiS family protein [Anaerolineae bacterium]|jgi:sulfur carrier protein ThiS|nr:MoaD/ThiS family protein [Anaerolineae bacterium]
MSDNSVTIILKNKTYQVNSGIPLHKALRFLNLNTNTHLAVRDGMLITEDEMLKNGDRIELIAVISGG